MDRDVKFFLGLIVCTLVVVVPLLQVSGGWWVPALPPMVVREWKLVPPPNPMQLTADSGSNVDPIWSPDNWHLAFASNRFGNWSIWTMCEDGSKQRQLTVNATINRYPSWSPDGSKIAYLSHVKGQWDLWVMNVDGTRKTNLANGPVFEGVPQWSPDGRLILFTKQHPRWNVWVTCTDGVYQAQLTEEGDNLYPSWSSDGKTIVYSSNRSGNWDIWIMNADGTNHTQLTTAPEDDIKPTSPDGKNMVFLSSKLGNWGIWRMGTDGKYQVQLVASVNEDSDPSCSPDGKRILFTWNRHFEHLPRPDFDVYVVNINGANLTDVTTFSFLDEKEPCFSPDCTKIACAVYCQGTWDIWLYRFVELPMASTSY